MKKLSQWLVVVCGLFFLFGQESVAMDKMNISVYPVYPENQSKGVKGYFSLEVEDEKTQTLELEVYNHENIEKTISIHLTNALTTENGGILYVPEEEAGGSKLLHSQFAMKQYVKTEEQITLKPKEKKKIKLHVTFPKEHLGTYLGGILFKEEKETEKVGTKEGAFIQQQSFSGIALQISFQKREKNALSYQEVKTELTPTIKRILVGFKNESSNLIQDATLNYEIYDGEKKLFEGKNTDVDIAPMSRFYYPINWSHESIENGHYTIKASITLNKNQKTLPGEARELISFEEVFEIKPEAIQQVLKIEQSINPKPIIKEDEKKEKQKNVTLIILIGIIVLLLFTLLFVLFKKKKKRRANPEE